MGGYVKISKTKALNSMRIRAVFAVLALAVMICMGYSTSFAFDIPTGNDDLQFRWDNTVRYFLQYRVASQDDTLLNSANADDGDRNFDKGLVSNRLDLLSEMDLLWKSKDMGIRFSGAFWYDQIYHSGFDNESVATSNYLDSNGNQTVNRLYKYADRRYAGPSGELLDAFVFAKIDAGFPIYVKVGRHIYSWGESLFDPFHGINYGQMPLDLAKAAVMPGTEVKEVFRPLNAVSVIAQITPAIQVAAQYFLQWQRTITPDGGTLFGTSDVSLDGEGAIILGPGVYARHGRDIEAARNRDFGIALKFNPPWSKDATLGLYYRKFSDKLPQVILTLDDLTYHCAYKSNIDLYGISYSTTLPASIWGIGGSTMGTELSLRKHMPLNSGTAAVLSSSLPDDGDVLGAVGETMHAIVNLLGFLPRTSLWDAGTWSMEFDFSRYNSVESDPLGTFAGEDSHAFGHATREAMNSHFGFTPQYLQILPGLDMSVPMSLEYGLFGVSSVAAGQGEGDGVISIGFQFDYLSAYHLTFTYANLFGKLDDSSGSAVTRGNYGLKRDRDYVALTFKYAF